MRNSIWAYPKRAISLLVGLLEILGVIFLGATVLFMVLQIIFRDILNIGRLTSWVWESVSLLNIWIIYLGAAALAWPNKHIALSIIDDRLSPRLVSCVELFKKLVIIFTSYQVVVLSFGLFKRQLKTSLVTLPFLTRGHGSLAVVVGFFLILLFTLHDFLDDQVCKRRQHELSQSQSRMSHRI